MTSRDDRDLSAFRFEVKPATALSLHERRELRRLFEAGYRQANPVFLEKSLVTLRWVAIARHNTVTIGFAIAETRLLDLPRLPRQAVSLAGLCCVAETYRRRGLFGELEMRAFAAGAPPAQPRRLLCGRVAHPAAMRGLARLASVVPRPGVRPTPWQQAVGRAVAQSYGAHAFDPETFVCIGDGAPIGHPVLALEAETHEWEVFRAVKRERGDALLAIAWAPSPPPDWEAFDTPP